MSDLTVVQSVNGDCSWIKFLSGAFALLITGLPVTAQEPIGSEFRVDQQTSFSPSDPKVAIGSGGGFLVVWTSFGSVGDDDSLWSVQGRMFASDPSQAGDQFQINTYTSDTQQRPEVARGADGNFFVVWSSDGSSGTENSQGSAQGQLLDTNGLVLGTEFQINSYTVGGQGAPSIAASANGFVVAWYSSCSDGYSCGGFIKGQRYDLDGNSVNSEFKINTAEFRQESSADVAASADESFVVVWMDNSPGVDEDRWIKARQFDTQGVPLDDEFFVNLDQDRLVGNPRVIVDSTGNFSVFWLEDTSVMWRRFSATGTPLTGEMRLSETGVFFDPFSISRDPQNRVVAIWRSDNGEGSWVLADLIGKGILPPSSALSQFDVSLEEVFKMDPDLDHFANGTFLAVWQSQPFEPSATSSIQSRVYSAPTALFVNGFESGDTSAWSSTQ